MTPASGQTIIETPASPVAWPATRPIHPISPRQVGALLHEHARVAAEQETRLANARYRHIETVLDAKNKIFWCYMRPDGVPSFTHPMLAELAHMQRSIRRLFDESTGSDVPVRHLVVASQIPGIYSMGGDLGFFADRIRAGDRAALATYARACIEVVYNNAVSLDLPMVTVALVQGDALGGGFEAALSCNVIIAEKSAKLGLPEILFNLFPGMGAYSLLSRKLDRARAERMILSGRIYSATELYEMGLVDELVENGEGVAAVRHYIARSARYHRGHQSLCEVRRRVNPLTFSELRDVIEVWVDAAMRLEEPDLRKMERLMAAQRRRLRAHSNNQRVAAV